jgi:23S rRNA (guanine745-N1)-methyltransferase
MLACTVKRCGLPLEKRERAFVCEHGHSFDIARSGYINLLQPQDRRSREPGDSKDAVAARAALFAAGIGRTLIDAVAGRADRLTVAGTPVVVDLGSGTGDALAAIARTRAISGIGIDLSSAAAELAARRFPDCTWIVANADRRLPLIDACVDVMISVHGRRHPEETARTLRAGGALVVALPAADDLIELRTIVQGEAVQRQRADTVATEHARWFDVAERDRVSETLTLDRDALLNLLRSTYRGARLRLLDRVAGVSSMAVTLASDVLVMMKRREAL